MLSSESDNAALQLAETYYFHMTERNTADNTFLTVAAQVSALTLQEGA